MTYKPKFGGERPPDEDIERWRTTTLPSMRAEVQEVERKATEWQAKGRSLRSIHRFENRASILKLLITEMEAELAYWTAQPRPSE